jgi:hypothetical protein
MDSEPFRRVISARNGNPSKIDRLIVTQTDHDFVDLKVKPGKVRKALARAAAAVAVAAGLVVGGAGPASAADAGSVTTTFHHPFYDVTPGAKPWPPQRVITRFWSLVVARARSPRYGYA